MARATGKHRHSIDTAQTQHIHRTDTAHPQSCRGCRTAVLRVGPYHRQALRVLVEHRLDLPDEVAVWQHHHGPYPPNHPGVET